jgi:predicted AlkP superfamily pyrophosphatase or phosphodiesterase
MKNALLPGVMLLASLAPGAAHAEPLLFISIDGLRPGDVLEAEKRGINIPNLRRFVTEGSYASGVIGILPTVTYPSHTTLMTGVSPAKHGIVGNTTFDPMQINQTGWYWYAPDIKVLTLWDAARKAGMTTANVHWPVSVDAKSVTWNLPQLWRTGHADDAKLVKALSTPGLVDELESHHGPYAAGIDESIEGDENRAKFAVGLIGAKKPDFITVYLTALDHEQHQFGPGTKEAHLVLQRIDALIGQLIAAELKARPNAVIAVASDHGFAATDTEISLFRPFIDAGLITLDGDGKVKSWEAMPWPSGGSIAVVLARPDDKALEAKVGTLLDQLKANPDAKIASVINRSEIAKMGGNPQAAFYVNLGPEALAGSFKGASAPLASPSKTKGMHGYFPAAPEMQSTFMMMGKSVSRARSFGEIDMRSIAPTLALLMKVSLPDAELKPLP